MTHLHKLNTVSKHITQKWYTSYNGYNTSLCSNEDIIDTNIIIAKLVINNSLNNKYLFTKFYTTSDVVDYFRCCKDVNKKLYVVLRNKFRYLYIDVDYQTSNVLSQTEQTKLKYLIIKTINNYLDHNKNICKYTYNKQKWFVWSATRNNKFSLHCINTSIILPNDIIQQIIQNVNIILYARVDFPKQCKLDDKVYKTHYQLWRLPMCYKYNQDSQFKLITTPIINITKQFEINFMNFNQSTYLNTYTTNQTKTFKTKRNQKRYLDTHNNCISTLQTQPEVAVRNKIYKIFNITTLNKKDINGFILKDHICPIKNNPHRNNTARIKIINEYKPNTSYVRYNCFDSDCQQQAQYIFITLSNVYKRPWLFNKMDILSANLMKQLDDFIDDLLFNKVIHINNKCKLKNITHNDNGIIEHKSLRWNDNNYTFTCFLKNNIIHTQCNNNALTLLLKKKSHKFACKGLFVMKCAQCKPMILHEYNYGSVWTTRIY